MDPKACSPPIPLELAHPSCEVVVSIHPKYYYVDVPHVEESTYNACERHVSINPGFHIHLQKHHKDNIT